MTEREIIVARINFLEKGIDLFTRSANFEIKVLEEQMENLTITSEMPKQKPRATNFDYKNEIEVGDPETV